MKKMPTLARKWFKHTGRTLMILWCAIPVHAQPIMKQPSGQSVQGADMRPAITDEQRAMALRMLTTAMAILRDDQPFDPAQLAFGGNFATEPIKGSVGKEYSFENSVLPRTQIVLMTEGDPADYTANRMMVKPVPTIITIRFSPLMEGINRSSLEDMLHLGIGYWIDGNGNRRPGNDMGTTPPPIYLHHYRYRALDRPTSRFPVDVELTFGDPGANPMEDGGSTTPVLMDVILSRAYPALTREKREQRRLDQQAEKRQKYGMMNLCTGMLCPETGLWEGWSENGATDKLFIRAGARFDEVRLHAWEPGVCEQWVNGKWFWLGP
ncbi:MULTISPECIES: hypothetical protein [Paraburkholderia]|uniref:hypothetical protein n=1 Tax=Paraburkholderia TaxID=1822464 RepID=UPI00224EA94C|nr:MULTISPECIES: hypothetical protein [Paraburkholderia]MCX4172780.1 hypothetical protein [Paraburkholderia madseniana]MDQ6460788.1 hypothetical protein [Paraburkholderia madseniana]